MKGKLVNGVGRSTLHTTSERGVSSITTADAHTSAASSRLDRHPTDLIVLVRFAERRNLVSARVPSHFKGSLSAGLLAVRCSSPEWSSLVCLRSIPLDITYKCTHNKQITEPGTELSMSSRTSPAIVLSK